MIPRLLLLLAAAQAAAPPPPTLGTFRFAILGDRTGETVPGIYERVWKEAVAEEPAFVLSVGDTIQGLNDATAEPEWRAWEALVAPWHRVPIHLAAGNHDIWSAASAELFRKHAGSAEHYSFDYGPTHFTVLDNSRSEALSDGEMAFLEADLKAHAGQPINFVISHRPSWIIDALVRHPDFPFHRLMRRYGVRYVVAGHIHEMLHYSLEGVEYISMASAGGHLRSSGKYEDGWFFGYASVDVRGTAVAIQIHELNGRTTPLEAWGPAGLVSREK